MRFVIVVIAALFSSNGALAQSDETTKERMTHVNVRPDSPSTQDKQMKEKMSHVKGPAPEGYDEPSRHVLVSPTSP